jgi:hypothetical protein
VNIQRKQEPGKLVCAADRLSEAQARRKSWAFAVNIRAGAPKDEAANSKGVKQDSAAWTLQR